MLEEFMVIFANMTDWMANSYPTWEAFHVLLTLWFVSINKCLGVYPIFIGEIIHYTLTKIILRSLGDKAKTAYRKF